MQGTRVTIGTPSKRPSIFSFAYWFPSYSSSNRSVVATQEHAITRAAPSSSKGLRSWSNWTLPSFAFMRKTPSEKEMLEKLQQSENFQPKPEKSDKSFFDKVREMFS